MLFKLRIARNIYVSNGRLLVSGTDAGSVRLVNGKTSEVLVEGDLLPGGTAFDGSVDDLVSAGWSVVEVPPAPAPAPAVSLEARKGHRLSAVDSRSASLIAQGFTYQGTVLSASESAQLKWLGAYNSRDALTYPLLVPSLDNQTFISLADAQAVADVYAAAVNRVQQVLTEGAALKQQIVQAADADALAAIVDNRT